MIKIYEVFDDEKNDIINKCGFCKKQHCRIFTAVEFDKAIGAGELSLEGLKVFVSGIRFYDNVEFEYVDLLFRSLLNAAANMIGLDIFVRPKQLGIDENYIKMFGFLPHEDVFCVKAENIVFSHCCKS